MANFIDSAFLLYMFVGLYMLILFIFLYIPNRKKIFSYPEGKPVPISIVMPCYNEAEHIGEAIEALLKLDWPKDMLEIIVVDDKSTDNSADIVRRYERKYDNVRLIVNSRNSGKAAEPTNIGVKNAKYDYVAVADADSTPDRDALKKMIGFLQADEKTAAVTCAVLAKPPRTFMQKLQTIEYSVIAWNRKLLDLIDSVYVTPGPFALYKKRELIKVGLFDTKNMTQDIEIVWRFLSKGYKARMCLATKVHSATPERFRAWFRQRIRWNIGGTQTLWKYKKFVFKNGMLGAFIIPFFTLSLFLGLIGLAIFVYLIIRRFLVGYLSTAYSLEGNTALLYLQDFTFAPSFLNYFGAILFIAGAIFTIVGLGVMDQPRWGKGNVFNIFFYMIVYLSIYPIIMITALTKLATGKYSW
ncbi:MAG: glycosyltransferase family 2 protein [Nanoarchaeota archaeon]